MAPACCGWSGTARATVKNIGTGIARTEAGMAMRGQERVFVKTKATIASATFTEAYCNFTSLC